MDDDFAKSAGEIVGSALCGKGGEETRKKARGVRYRPEYWSLVNLSIKLSAHSDNWRAVAGAPLDSRSAPAASAPCTAPATLSRVCWTGRSSPWT